ncbi:hypothetical protein CONCODRAFT_10373 [Conidiobolus coronatus NRRL 28638]|uniref:Retrotransposon gag domain-containing protein n=1 Tax=Conidiobolus coronatus (strain ATCC 28846 / CBS 209.66 / NRRL 28638) TaxID=796925 RepID=A0A137NXZ9_CONC2|nr:hypothetical protein CONCODRAFT_10373 [Conidiobolus coronatus NRRL 28638]|eukprot:KXN67541.1 hypothetical protein CONCODRAFT_10373 [Conidiobolus coronatus NRRL 28638]
MSDSLPFANQKYNNSIFRIAVYKLVDQAPGLVSLTLDVITSKLSGRATEAFFKEVLPFSQSNLVKNDITIRYPDKKKVTYYWICKKLIQLLYWTESRRAINLSEIWENSKINFAEINENILKTRQIMSEYASHPASNPELLGFDNSRPIESSALPSYQNAIEDQDLVGTSNSHLTTRIQQNENFSEINGHSREHNSNSPFASNTLSYCFDGSDKLKARSFINDYDSLAFINKWSSEDKIEFFPNHLEKDALSWYLCISPNHRSNWQDLKIEFISKYLID